MRLDRRAAETSTWLINRRDSTVVVLSSRRPLERRSWICRQKGEATAMVEWLSENGITATAMSMAAWYALNKRGMMEQP